MFTCTHITCHIQHYTASHGSTSSTTIVHSVIIFQCNISDHKISESSNSRVECWIMIRYKKYPLALITSIGIPSLLHTVDCTVTVLSGLINTTTHCKVTSLPSHTLPGPVAGCLKAKENMYK